MYTMQQIVDLIYVYMMPVMLISFGFGVFARLVIYLSIRAEHKFITEFEHRVEKFMSTDDVEEVTFHEITKKILNKTHYEFYRLKAEKRRRKFDVPISFLERIFFVVTASERLIDDTLKHTRYAKHSEPDFDRIAKYTFSSNPYYNRFLGVIPNNVVDDLLNAFPGLLIICGILGTFVGIVNGIPELKLMDVTDINATSRTLNGFLDNMGFAMTTSILGLVLSLLMTVVNTAFAPYDIYVDLIQVYKSSLSFIWKESQAKAKLKGNLGNSIQPPPLLEEGRAGD